MLHIRHAMPAELERTQGLVIPLPVAGYVGEADGKPVGSGGLAWWDGRCWLWFNVEDSRPQFALPAIRHGRKMMALAKTLGETTVYASQDPNAPSSGKLLRMMGFTPNGELFEGHEVFACALG